jgi:hypothetical protein
MEPRVYAERAECALAPAAELLGEPRRYADERGVLLGSWMVFRKFELEKNQTVEDAEERRGLPAVQDRGAGEEFEQCGHEPSGTPRSSAYLRGSIEPSSAAHLDYLGLEPHHDPR